MTQSLILQNFEKRKIWFQEKLAICIKNWPMEEFVEWISITYAYHRTKNLRQFKWIKTGFYDDKVTGSKPNLPASYFFHVFRPVFRIWNHCSQNITRYTMIHKRSKNNLHFISLESRFHFTSGPSLFTDLFRISMILMICSWLGVKKGDVIPVSS